MGLVFIYVGKGNPHLPHLQPTRTTQRQADRLTSRTAGAPIAFKYILLNIMQIIRQYNKLTLCNYLIHRQLVSD